MKPGYRISVFWEEVGTTAEGSMEGEQQITVGRKPTKPEMLKIKKGVERLLVEMGMIGEKKP